MGWIYYPKKGDQSKKITVGAMQIYLVIERYFKKVLEL